MNTQTLLLLAAAGGVGYWIFSQRAKQQSDTAANNKAALDLFKAGQKASERTKSEQAGGLVGEYGGKVLDFFGWRASS